MDGSKDEDLVCMAEDYGTGDILTLDMDFEFYRWSLRKPFTLLIDKHVRSKK